MNIQAQETIQRNQMGLRPMVNKKTGEAKLVMSNGLVVNSVLTRDEWETVQRIAYAPAGIRTNMFDILSAAGLIINEDLFVIVSQWDVHSERAEASESILMSTIGEQDMADFIFDGVTVPILKAPFGFDNRTLGASRRMGSPLSTTNAEMAGRAIRELRDSHILLGSSTQRDANSVTFGVVNHPDTITDTAANFGGGDWGTPANILPTVTGMISTASTAANRRHGPYALLCATTQFNQAQLSFIGVDSQNTILNQINSIESISQTTFSDTLADGTIVLLQLTSDVIDYTLEMDVNTMEYVNAAGTFTHFNVMFAGAPRVKGDYDNRTGVIVATGA